MNNFACSIIIFFFSPAEKNQHVKYIRCIKMKTICLPIFRLYISRPCTNSLDIRAFLSFHSIFHKFNIWNTTSTYYFEQVNHVEYYCRALVGNHSLKLFAVRGSEEKIAQDEFPYDWIKSAKFPYVNKLIEIAYDVFLMWCTGDSAHYKLMHIEVLIQTHLNECIRKSASFVWQSLCKLKLCKRWHRNERLLNSENILRNKWMQIEHGFSQYMFIQFSLVS